MDKLKRLKKLKNGILTVIFVFSWIAVYLLTASFEQFMISSIEYLVYSAIALTTLITSGTLTGMLTFRNERGKRR